MSFWQLVGYVILGLIVGALGRLAVPGSDPMTAWRVGVAGFVGVFVGGLLAGAVVGKGHAVTTFVVGVVVAIFFVAGYSLWHRSRSM